MKLFEIAKEIENCVKLESGEGYVNVETGELIDEAALDALEMAKDEKLKNIGCLILNWEAEEKMLAEQEARFRDRRQRLKRRRERLEDYAGRCLNNKNWECTECEFRFRKTETVRFYGNIKEVPKEYLRYSDPEIDKIKIKKALKDGLTINGCVLEVGSSLKVK